MTRRLYLMSVYLFIFFVYIFHLELLGCVSREHFPTQAESTV